MDRKKFLIRLALLIFFIFLVNLVALKFYWYYSIWYFDMIMHFLGGLWLGLAFFWLFSFKELSLKLILKVILGILLIGIFWEIFEILVNKTIAQNPFNILDAVSDIYFDLAGGIFAILYFLKRIMFKQKSAI